MTGAETAETRPLGCSNSHYTSWSRCSFPQGQAVFTHCKELEGFGSHPVWYTLSTVDSF